MCIMCKGLIFSCVCTKHLFFPTSLHLTAGDAVLEVDGGEPVSLALKDILRFATGAEAIPPLGFQRCPTLVFLHDLVDNQLRKYPEANTCGMILHLPLHRSYEDFSDFMISGIV